MKLLILVLLSMTAFAQAPLDRHLSFTYETTITPSIGAHVFSSTNVTLPLEQWTYLGSVTNLQFSNAVPIQLKWRQEFFIVGASNEYSIGGISNLVFSEVLTSVPPTSVRNQRIQ